MEQYIVTGMSCAACSARVEKAVSKVPGVTSCSVSLLTNSMGVEGTATEQEIIKAVEDAGYGASKKGEGAAKAQPAQALAGEDMLKDRETPVLKRRLIASVGFLIVLMYFSMGHMMWGWPVPGFMKDNHVMMGLLQMLLTITVMVINQKFFISGFKGLIHRAPNMDTLVALGSGASFVYSTYALFAMTDAQMHGDMDAVMSYMHDFYFESAAMILALITVGKMLEARSKGKTTDALKGLMKLAPKTAVVIRAGKEVQVSIEQVQKGDCFVVKPGERIPLDGVVIEGESLIDTAALTGESVPRRASEGDEIISGCVNGSGTLKIRTTKEFDDSTVAKILELVENASSKKAKVENFITRFAKYYTPVVTIGAVLLAVIPPLILGGGFAEWIQRACIFLVISCPCALVISVPLGFFGGIGAASKIGVLVKGSNFLEAVAEMTTIVFDKTGTLTKGEFKVTEMKPAGVSKDKLLEVAALGESYSNHPIAGSIIEAYGKEIERSRVLDAVEIAGHGVQILVDGVMTYVGNEKLMKKQSIAYEPCESAGTVVYVGQEQTFLGALVISDTVKEGAAEAIHKMKNVGVKKCVMLTGDREKAAKHVADELKLDEVHAELLPGDKVDEVEKLLSAQKEGERLAFVGDGINDAPVLTRADIGIAMGSLGSDAAIEAADVVLMDDDIRKIASTVLISRKTLRIVKQNIVFALAVKAVVLLLGAIGVANMWEAVFADVGVSVLAILNSMRVMKNH